MHLDKFSGAVADHLAPVKGVWLDCAPVTQTETFSRHRSHNVNDHLALMTGLWLDSGPAVDTKGIP